jgi:hypothetical protein
LCTVPRERGSNLGTIKNSKPKDLGMSFKNYAKTKVYAKTKTINFVLLNYVRKISVIIIKWLKIVIIIKILSNNVATFRSVT